MLVKSTAINKYHLVTDKKSNIINHLKASVESHSTIHQLVNSLILLKSFTIL